MGSRMDDAGVPSYEWWDVVKLGVIHAACASVIELELEFELQRRLNRFGTSKIQLQHNSKEAFALISVSLRDFHVKYEREWYHGILVY